MAIQGESQMTSQDNLHCLKNLMQLMRCDGRIHSREKEFLKKAAGKLDVAVDDWNALLQEIIHDNVTLYPMQNRRKAVSALKAMMVMAQSDGVVDDKEKKLLLQFAKSIGVSKSEWKEIISSIDIENLFTPFQKLNGQLIALTDDFEKIEDFRKVACDNGADIQITDLEGHLTREVISRAAVCFHAAENKDVSVSRCKLLLERSGGGLICVLNRFQGHQVKYLHEAGLKKCVIEPVYARDIQEIFQHAVVM